MKKGNTSNRAGRYITQPNGYKAFVPAALPPEPPITIDNTIQVLLSRADRALGRLDGSIQTLPNPDLFVFMYVRKEAVLSSQIEGTQSSLQDVLEVEAKILSPDHPRDVAEVVNYVKAMNYGLRKLKDLPVSIRLIREIHAKLLTGVRGTHLTPGELRTSQNWIGPGGCTLKDATFIPPPPDVVPVMLSDLEKFLHSESSVPLLIKIGLAHAQFETIHPFLDGNGRVGRLLITFLLCEKEVLSKPVLYLSYYFKKHRQQYYELLQAIRDEGAWERWLMFFLKGIIEVSEQATTIARQVLILKEKHRQVITEKFGRTAANGYRLLEHLFENPIMTVTSVRNLLDANYPVANDLVNRMVECSILREYTGNVRNRKFIYDRYIQLFCDDTADKAE